MSIEELVKKHFDRWVTDTEFGNVEVHLRAALTELAAEHDRKQALLLEAHCERVSSLQERIRELEVQRVPDGWKLVPSRCPLCEYQHGHKIGCENNPVDIALRDAAIPPGFVAVPVEPTHEMLEAMREKHWEIRGCQLCAHDYRDIHTAMLAAAPATKGEK